MKDRLQEQADIAVLEAKVREQAAVIAELERRLKEMQATEAARTKYHPKVLEQAERIVVGFEAEAVAARERLKTSLGSKFATERGDAAPELNLGFYGGASVEVTKDAAERGNAEAQVSLGCKYYFGMGVERSDAEALKWFRKAAEQGHVSGQFNLGSRYEEGEGVAKDYVEAYAWYNLASVTKNIVAEYRDDLEKKMTPQQVADAQKRTKELRVMIEAKAGK